MIPQPKRKAPTTLNKNTYVTPYPLKQAAVNLNNQHEGHTRVELVRLDDNAYRIFIGETYNRRISKNYFRFSLQGELRRWDAEKTQVTYRFRINKEEIFSVAFVVFLTLVYVYLVTDGLQHGIRFGTLQVVGVLYIVANAAWLYMRPRNEYRRAVRVLHDALPNDDVSHR